MSEFKSPDDSSLEGAPEKNDENQIKAKLKELIPSHIKGWRRKMITAILTSEVFEEDPPSQPDDFFYQAIVNMGERSVAFNCTNAMDFHIVLSEVSKILSKYKETVDPDFKCEFLLEPESSKRIKQIVEGNREQISTRLRDESGHSPFPVPGIGIDPRDVSLCNWPGTGGRGL